MISKVVKHMYEGTNTRPNIDKDFKYGPYDDPNIPCVKVVQLQFLIYWII